MSDTMNSLIECAVSPTEFGKVEGHGTSRRVEVRREIKTSIAKTWEAITNADQMSKWFTECDFELIEGSQIALHFSEDAKYRRKEHTNYGVIKLIHPQNIFGYTWETDGVSSWVQFDLIEGDHGSTLLTIMSIGMTAKDGWNVGVGWHQMTERLAHYLENDEAVLLEFDRVKEIYLHYKALEKAD